MVYTVTPTLTFITEDHYVCDARGHRAKTSSGTYVKVPKEYLKNYTVLKK